MAKSAKSFGTFSTTHAIRKSPRFEGASERVSDAVPIEEGERDLAGRALGVLHESLLYARVDVVLDLTGAPVVMELELIEPSLFLIQSKEALNLLVTGIQQRL